LLYCALALAWGKIEGKIGGDFLMGKDVEKKRVQRYVKVGGFNE